MSYLDRLREIKYTSPSGKTFVPLWDDFSRSGGKKTSVQEIPESNLAIVQDLGNQATRHPMALYFVGPNYDQTADAFFQALREAGPAKLAHPRYGNLDVLALTWSQAEDFVNDLAAARFQVEFIEAPAVSSLTSATNTAAAVAQAAEAANAAASVASAAELTTQNAGQLAQLKSEVRRRVRAMNATLSNITNIADEIREEIETITRNIELGIDTLAQAPIALMESITSLARAPSRAIVRINDKLNGYSGLIADSFAALASSPPVAMAVQIATMIAQAFAAIESTSEGQLATRTDAITAHDGIVALIAQVELAIEQAQAQGYTADPDVLALLAELKARAAALLLNTAFALPTERRAIITKAATPIHLAARFLGDPELYAELSELNGWRASSLIIVPAGSEVIYYA